MTERDAGYVQALERMVAHCRRLMLDRETPPEGREEHRALIDYMEGQIEQLQERINSRSAVARAYAISLPQDRRPKGTRPRGARAPNDH